MAKANVFFIIGMATYFIIGDRNSYKWSDFYYTVLFGYVSCILLIDKKRWYDQIIGISIVGSIWFMYLIHPICNELIYQWCRFGFGILLGAFGLFYLIYVIFNKQYKNA